MHYLIVTDIFGKTPAFTALAESISPSCNTLDPYQGEHLGFSNEASAYQYFSRHVGLERYTKMLRQQLEQYQDKVKVIGFSVGGSAIWCASQNSQLMGEVEAIAFYPSQVRRYSHIEPAFPIHLVWPSHEAHFCVPTTIDLLSGIHNVSQEQVSLDHGFMNATSSNYNGDGCRQFTARLQNEYNHD